MSERQSIYSVALENAFEEFVQKKEAIYPAIRTDMAARGAIREIFEAGFVAAYSAAQIESFQKRLR